MTLWQGLLSYPPSLLALLLAFVAGAVLLFGGVAALLKKEGGDRLATGVTATPAVLVLVALLILAYGASSGISGGADAWVTADPATRSALLSNAIEKTMWASAIGATLLTLLIPPIAFGCALVWSVRNGRANKGRGAPWLVALGVAFPSFVLGSAIAAKVSGFIRMFQAVAYATSEDRGAIAQAGLEESQNVLASGASIAVLSVLGLGLVLGGAALAAKKQVVAGRGLLVIAALVAATGLASAVLVEVRATQADMMLEFLER